MKNKFIIFFIIIGLCQMPTFALNYYLKSPFKKLPTNEQIKVLREHKDLYLQKIDSKIKDINTQIQSINQNDSISLSKKQNMLLKLQQELTTLKYERSEIIERYDYKINSLK